jgi:hypothetical protein
MKTKNLQYEENFSSLFASFLCICLFAQDAGILQRTIPAVDIKTMTGEIFLPSILIMRKPMVISLLRLMVQACMRELTAIADVYTDCERNRGKVSGLSPLMMPVRCQM